MTVYGSMTIHVQRKDYVPFAPIYGPPVPLVCLAKDSQTPKTWNISVSENVHFGTQSDLFLWGKYAPSLNGHFNARVDFNEDTRCAMVTTESQSAAHLVVYTSTDEYIEPLSKWPHFLNLVTPSHVRQTVDLPENARNVVVVFLDSVEDGQSVKLENLDNNANIFAIGAPMGALDIVFQLISTIFNRPISSEGKTEYYADVKALTDQLVDKHGEFFPNISLSTNHVSSITIMGANYQGDVLDCDALYSVASSFKSESLNVTAEYTSVDTFTYGSLKNVQLNNLVLFPVCTSPIDHISISRVEFRNETITLKGTKGCYEIVGPQAERFEFNCEIPLENVSGKLCVLSFTNSVDLVIPEGERLSKVKGIELIMSASFGNDFMIYDFVPSVPLLEEQPSGTSTFHRFLEYLNESFGAFLEMTDMDSKRTVEFVGAWDQVVDIDDGLNVRCGNADISVRKTPAQLVDQIACETANHVSFDQTEKMSFPAQVVEDSVKKVYAGDRSSIEIYFSSIDFAGGTPQEIRSTSFVFVYNSVRSTEIRAGSVICRDYGHAQTPNKITVNDKLEMGVGSELAFGLGTRGISRIVFHFLASDESGPKLKAQDDRGEIQDWNIESLTLVCDTPNGTDLDEFDDRFIEIKTFKEKAKCKQWASRVFWESENANFSGTTRKALAKCDDDAKLYIHINLSLEEDDLVENPEYLPSPTEPEDPDNPNDPTTPEEPNNPNNSEEPNNPNNSEEPNNPNNSEESSNPDGKNDENNDSPVGPIVGGVIGALIVVGLVILAVFIIRKKSFFRNRMTSSSESCSNETVSICSLEYP